MKKVDAEVAMVDNGVECKMTFKQSFTAVGKLGREIKISPKSHITLNKAGFSVEYFVDTVSICIGIGNDHTAELIMTKDAWEALNSGAEINIDTDKLLLEKLGF